MGRPSHGGEEILRRHFEPAIKAAETALDIALSTAPGDPSLIIARASVGLLERFIDKLIERIVNLDITERVAVYQLVASDCATFLNYSEDLIYPAVLELCGEQDADVMSAFPVPKPKMLAILRDALLQVTVTYTVKAGDQGERAIQVLLHDAREQEVREKKSLTRLPWEQMPEDVRDQAIREGQRVVTFILYREAVNG